MNKSIQGVDRKQCSLFYAWPEHLFRLIIGVIYPVRRLLINSDIIIYTYSPKAKCYYVVLISLCPRSEAMSSFFNHKLLGAAQGAKEWHHMSNVSPGVPPSTPLPMSFYLTSLRWKENQRETPCKQGM